MKDQEVQCCPKFDPVPWDGKIFEWKEKRFVKDCVLTQAYVPQNFGEVIVRLMGKVAGAVSPDWMCLSDHTSEDNMDLYIAVDREVPDVQNVKLSGKFLSKVYEGPFSDTQKWCADFEQCAVQQQYKINKWYMWYTTCPACAEKYGKNYVVVICEVD